MRRVILTVVLIGVAVVAQLAWLNGMHLPGSGVPDVVLIAVAGLGLAGGPVPGAVTGFAAGLCLDLAPPGSGVVGVYALVFLLVGWACGRCRPVLARSAVLPIVIAGVAVVLGELAVAGLLMGLVPDQVTFSSVRQVLPATLLYDLTLTPFLLFLVLFMSAWADEAAMAGTTADQARLRRARRQGSALTGGSRNGRQGLAGPAGTAGGAVLLGLGGWLAGPPRSRRARRADARLTPRLRRGGGRSGDGWIGGSGRAGLGGAGLGGARAGGAALSASQLRAGRAFSTHSLGGQSLTGLSREGRPRGGGPSRLRAGVAGSGAGGHPPRTLPARPVNLHLAARGHRDGLVGGVLRRARPAVTGAVVPGRGLSRRRVSGLGRRRSRGGFRPSVLPGGSALSSPGRAGLTVVPSVKFGGRSRDGVVGGGMLTRFGGAARRASAPRFRIRPGGLPGRPATAAPTGAVGPQALQALRGRVSQPRVRMRPRRGDGVLNGLLPHGRARGAGASRAAAPRFRTRPLVSRGLPSGKRPRFGYRRYAPVAVLTRRHGGLSRLWHFGGRSAGPGGGLS